MESSRHNRANISPTNCNKMLIFWQVGIFHHAFSEYTNKSHNFINLVFMTSSLKDSIALFSYTRCTVVDFKGAKL